MSHLSSPTSKKYFTYPWTLTTPAHPSLTFTRLTPTHIPLLIPIVANAANNVHMPDVATKTWSRDEINVWKVQTLKSYNTSLTGFNHLTVVVLERGKVIGYGDLFLLSSGRFNVGLVLDSAVHGRGLGKLGVRVLVQLGFRIGKEGEIEAGTMGSNTAMRGVMRSLGVEEREEVVRVEGRGVLAELGYTVKREGWEEVRLDVEWGGGELGVVERVD